MSTISKGLSAYLSFGNSRGFKILKDGPSIRILLGKLSICFALIDLESLVESLLNELKNKDIERNLENKKNSNQTNIDDLKKTLKESIDREKIFAEKLNEIENKITEEINKEKELIEHIDDLECEITDLNCQLPKAKALGLV